jgi:hypothetical protein
MSSEAEQPQGWFQGAWRTVTGTVKECIWGPPQHVRKVFPTQQGNLDVPAGATAPKVNAGPQVKQALYGIAHLAASGIIAYAIGDWLGFYTDSTTGAAYRAVAALTTAWLLAATVGNNRLLPAHLITNAVDGDLSLIGRKTATALTVAGTGLSIAWIPAVLSLSSAHKAEVCLGSYLFRNFAGYLIGILLIEKGGEALAAKFMPRHKLIREETPSIGWHMVERLFACSSQIFSMYFMVYTHRGWVAFNRVCEEDGLGTPNPQNDPFGFQDVQKQAFLNTLVATGIMGSTLFPYLKEKGIATGRMIRDYIGTKDPILVGTLCVSAVVAGAIGAGISDHALNYAIPQQGPLAPPQAFVATVLGQFPEPLAPYKPALTPGLTQAFTVAQAAQGWYPTGPIPSSTLVGVVRSASVIFALSLTSLVQEGVEGTVRAFLMVRGKKSQLLDHLKRWAAKREIKAQGPYLKNNVSRAARVTSLQAKDDNAYTVNPLRRGGGLPQ